MQTGPLASRRRSRSSSCGRRSGSPARANSTASSSRRCSRRSPRIHVVAALLVRLGGYAVGVFEGERLLASKVGSRFVKGRHKKGGSSANRFRRRREEQARAFIDAAVATAERVLEPHRERIERVALG